MGCFDTVILPCPKCGAVYEAQSKSGDCAFETYTLGAAPVDVLPGINDYAPFRCSECHTFFVADLQVVVNLRVYRHPQETDDED